MKLVFKIKWQIFGKNHKKSPTLCTSLSKQWKSKRENVRERERKRWVCPHKVAFKSDTKPNFVNVKNLPVPLIKHFKCLGMTFYQQCVQQVKNFVAGSFFFSFEMEFHIYKLKISVNIF